jgi:predicted short-subunit dehydrogenase-like oxidoreductase (DUF2520 family)
VVAVSLKKKLARGDHRTIERHLAALEGDPFHAIYASFVAAHRAACREEAP